jgi:hypothetical protein
MNNQVDVYAHLEEIIRAAKAAETEEANEMGDNAVGERAFAISSPSRPKVVR